MSTAFQTQHDPTAGLSLVSTRAQNLEVTRYLFGVGQLLDPDRVLQLEHIKLAGGGEEINTNCFRRTVGGFLPRARLTPLEVWSVPTPPVLLSDGAERDTVRIATSMNADNLEMNNRRAGALAGVGAGLVGVPFYPGDEISPILRANENKGVVEVSALMGVDWYERDGNGVEDPRKPGVPQLLNRDFFPTTPPIELRKVREIIYAKESASDLHRKVAKDMIKSCDRFQRWAETILAVEHEFLRTRRSHQHTYTYSPIARELLRQLEMKPQDNILEGMSGGINPEQLREILASVGGGSQISPELIGQIAGVVANQILNAQAQANTPPTQTSEMRELTPAQKRAETLARKKAEEESRVAFDSNEKKEE